MTVMASSDNKAEKKCTSPEKAFSMWKVLLPVAIGLVVVVLMFWHDAKGENLAQVWRGVRFTPLAVFCIFFAIVCMGIRDFGLTWRFRALTDRKLSWGQSWTVDMMCEFTNCVTPSAVGGSSLGPVYLNSEGVDFGRATTLMLTTLFMDELFFVLACPLVVLVTDSSDIFSSGGEDFSHGIKYTFWAVYAFIAAWTFLLFTGIIWKPDWIMHLLSKVASWRWLSRFSTSISSLGDNMVATSIELRSKPFRFWVEVFCGTALAWIARYFVVNALFLGFLPGTDRYQWIILARQFVIWVVLMVSPTPGGAGLSEWLFSNYYGDLVGTAGMALIMAIFWRLITYYLYLVIGVVIAPGWLKRYYARIHARRAAAVTVQDNVKNSQS